MHQNVAGSWRGARGRWGAVAVHAGARDQHGPLLGPRERVQLQEEHDYALVRRQKAEVAGLGPPAHGPVALLRACGGEERAPGGIGPPDA